MAGVPHGTDCRRCTAASAVVEGLAAVWDPHGQWDTAAPGGTEETMTEQAERVVADALHTVGPVL